jgi:DNA-binding response OmpR family regulator
VSQSGRVVRRRQLIEQVWGDRAPPTDRAIDAHVKSIRRKLGSARDCIETVRGVGYRFVTDPVTDPGIGSGE